MIGSPARMVKATAVISFHTLLSRVLGFIRDMVLARALGAGLGADAFLVAFKLPNFLRRLFAEGAFNTAFIPVFSDYVARDDPEATRRAAQAVFTMLFTVLVAVVAVAQVIMPVLITIAAPGFAQDPGKFELTVTLTRITFPYILFISLVALAGGILNSFQRFAIPAATPTLLNLAMIAGGLWIAPRFDQPAMGLAIGVFLGGVAQLALQIPALIRLGFPFRFRWEPAHDAVKRVLALMGPAVLGVSVAQISLFFDVFLVSWLPPGSISYLYYADRVMEFPLGLIGIAMGTVVLPAFSAHAARDDHAGLRHDLDYALRLGLAVNLPATVALIVLRFPILALLFEGGAFTPEVTQLTSQALVAYTLGLISFSAVKVVAPAFYALKDTRTPVRVAVFSLMVNMALNVALIFPLKHVGLALATTLTSFLNLGLLLYYLADRLGYRPGRALLATLVKSALASAVMGGLLMAGTERFWQPGLATTTQLIILLPLMLAGLLAYLLTAWLLRLPELTEMIALIRRRKRGTS